MFQLVCAASNQPAFSPTRGSGVGAAEVITPTPDEGEAPLTGAEPVMHALTISAVTTPSAGEYLFTKFIVGSA
jgi:hypothetical protein